MGTSCDSHATAADFFVFYLKSFVIIFKRIVRNQSTIAPLGGEILMIERTSFVFTQDYHQLSVNQIPQNVKHANLENPTTNTRMI